MPLDVLGCTRATLLHSASEKLCLKRLGNLQPKCNETMTPLSALEFRTAQRALTGRLQPRPSKDMVMLPSSDRTTPTAVERLSHGIPVF